MNGNGLRAFVAGVFGVEVSEVEPGTGPGSIPQWDSLGHMHLIAALEETYGVQLSIDEITSLHSVTDIAALLAAKGVSHE